MSYLGFSTNKVWYNSQIQDVPFYNQYSSFELKWQPWGENKKKEHIATWRLHKCHLPFPLTILYFVLISIEFSYSMNLLKFS